MQTGEHGLRRARRLRGAGCNLPIAAPDVMCTNYRPARGSCALLEGAVDLPDGHLRDVRVRISPVAEPAMPIPTAGKIYHQPVTAASPNSPPPAAKSASGWSRGQRSNNTVDPRTAIQTAAPPGEIRNTAIPPDRISPAAIGARPSRASAPTTGQPRKPEVRTADRAPRSRSPHLRSQRPSSRSRSRASSRARVPRAISRRDRRIPAPWSSRER